MPTRVSPLPVSVRRTHHRAGCGQNSLSCNDFRCIWQPSFRDLRLTGRSVQSSQPRRTWPSGTGPASCEPPAHHGSPPAGRSYRACNARYAALPPLRGTAWAPAHQGTAVPATDDTPLNCSLRLAPQKCRRWRQWTVSIMLRAERPSQWHDAPPARRAVSARLPTWSLRSQPAQPGWSGDPGLAPPPKPPGRWRAQRHTCWPACSWPIIQPRISFGTYTARTKGCGLVGQAIVLCGLPFARGEAGDIKRSPAPHPPCPCNYARLYRTRKPTPHSRTICLAVTKPLPGPRPRIGTPFSAAGT